MENKAKTTLIGGFILAIFVSVIAFAFWITRASEGRNHVDYEVQFEGSVSGLLVGSGVSFNGLRVGVVKAMRLNPIDPRQVLAVISIDPTTPIRTDTKVSLEYAGITGTAQVSMRGGISSAAMIPTNQGRIPLLYAENSAMQDLMAGARQIMGRADSIVERLDRTIADNQGSINNTVKNAEKFSNALGDSSDDVKVFLKTTADAARKIGEFSQKLDVIIAAIEPEKLKKTVDNIERITGALAAQSDAIGSFVSDAKATMGKMDSAFSEVANVLKALDSGKINSYLTNVEKFTDALAKNSGQVDSLIKDASEAAQKLNAMTARVDKLLSSFDSSGTGGMFSDFSEAAKSIKTLADKLDKRTAEMTAGIATLTSKGTREVESLVQDGKRALSQMERSLKSLETNPQRLIFGGSGVPEYNRR